MIEFHRILTVKVNHKLPGGKLKPYAVSQSEYLVVKLFVNVVGIMMAPNTFKMVTNRDELQGALDREKLQMVSTLSKLIKRLESSGS